MQTGKNPKIIVKYSRIHYRGVFARRDIKVGTRIIEYVGEKITKAEADRRAEIPLRNAEKNNCYGAVYIFELNKRYDIDGYVPYNTARFVNHSCDPNCETEIIRGRIWIVAIKEINKGREITYNYGYDFESYQDHQCYCKASNCIGYILAEEHWPRYLKHKSKLAK